MEYKTFDEWSEAGYKIKKGSKAKWIDDVAMFSSKQVEPFKKKFSKQENNKKRNSTS